MKKMRFSALLIAFALLLAACGDADTVQLGSSKAPGEPDPTETAQESTAMPTPVPTPEAAATASPTPTPEPDETPDRAGTGDIVFDIYVHSAHADLNGDAAPEDILLEAGDDASVLTIGASAYPIDLPGLAQRFAVTDVDASDGLLELVLTDAYDPDLADSEKACSYLYWWDGTGIVFMGSLMDVAFDGGWRAGFHAEDHFNAAGRVTCLARTTRITDIWYYARYIPDGSGRTLAEDLYETAPVGAATVLTLKEPCLLLKKIDSKYFGYDYNAMWDHASYPHDGGRVANPTPDIVIIAQPPENLTIVAVLGPDWIKLRTADGYAGWIKTANGLMLGYDDIMHITASEIFDGLIVAG